MNHQDNLFFNRAELAAVGKDVIIGRTVRLRKPDQVRIGDCSILDDFMYVSCGLTVGCFTHIGALTSIIGGTAHVSIGNFVNTSPGCRMVAASHDFSQGGLTGPAIPEAYAAKPDIADISMGDHVLLGANTVILPGTNVPEGVATGAMTLLTPKVPLEPWTLYVGQPARPIKRRASTAILDAADRLLADRGQA